jgi:uncharacterized protein YybS (DUF2232 family)
MSRLTKSPGTTPALAASVSLAMFLAAGFLPVMGLMVTMFSQVPIILVYRIHGTGTGRITALMAIAGAVLVLSMLASPLLAVSFAVHLLMGIVLGEAPYWNLSEDKAIGLATVLSSLAVVSFFALTASISGLGFEEFWTGYWDGLTRSFLEIVGASGTEAEAEVVEQLKQLGQMLFRISHSFLVGSMLFMVWANLILAKAILKRTQKVPLDEIPRLTTWKAPENLVWVLIASAALVLVSDGFWYWAWLNTLIIIGTIYFFQGVAVAAFWLQKINAPHFLGIVFFSLLLLEYRLGLVVAAAGLFDMWLDFRRPKKST